MKATRYVALALGFILALALAVSSAFAASGRSLNGTISGLVLSPNGRAMAGVEVQVWKSFPTGLYSADWQPYVTGVYTSKSGSYKIDVPPGTYRVWFKPADLATYCMEAYPDAALPYWGDNVVVKAGKATSRVSVNIDEHPGAVAGIAYDAVTDQPLAGIPVNLGIQGYAIVNMEFGRTLTGVDGSYRFDGLKSAAWTIWANPLWDSAYNALYCELYMQSDDAWTEPDGVKVIDADLEPVGFVSVSGYVFDGETGLPVSGIFVTPVYQDPWTGEWGHEWDWNAMTDENGYFEMVNIPAGTLMLWAGGNGLYQSQYYHGDWQGGQMFWHERGQTITISEFDIWKVASE